MSFHLYRLSQYTQDLRDHNGSRRLLLNVLKRALLDIELGARQRSRKARGGGGCRPDAIQAIKWIEEPNYLPKGAINSYESICGLFNIDPELLRDRTNRASVISRVKRVLNETGT